MTIRELIEVLSQYENQDAEVLIIEKDDNWTYDAAESSFELKSEKLFSEFSDDMNMLVLNS